MSDNKPKRGRPKKVSTVVVQLSEQVPKAPIPITTVTDQKKSELPMIVTLKITQSDINQAINPVTPRPIFQERVVIPVFPGNLPIRLFTNGEQTLDNTRIDTDRQAIKGKALLPLLKSNRHRGHGEIIAPIATSGFMLKSPSGISNTIVRDNEWPESSPYPCWNCDRNFSWAPVGIPEYEMNGYFYCRGNFCRIPCAFRHLLDTRQGNSSDFWTSSSLLHSMNALQTGNSDPIIPAPSRLARQKYGGYLSDKEFDDVISNQTHQIELYTLPLVPVEVHIDEFSKSVKPTALNVVQQTVPTGIYMTPDMIEKDRETVKSLVGKKKK